MPAKQSYLTATDQFCGAGGSSIGVERAGVELRLALNHWKLAIETHQTNFEDALHDCTDISACDPRRYPSTDLLITSPECVNHSLAKGKARKWQKQLDLFGQLKVDPAEERSRATMWDVPRFAEFHGYNIIIVENVVEARHWRLWDSWLHAMDSLGYNHECVFFNSMFAHPTPQSRDRMYVVFWRKGNRAPNLKITPPAYCSKCERNVASVQSWKNPRKKWGKYKAQYVYRCPECAIEVMPYYFAAYNAIDWSIPAPRIGDRKRPLKDKTLRRIQVGLDRFGRQALVVANYSPGWSRPMTEPTGTVTATDHHAVVTPPFLIETKYSHGHDRRSYSVEGPWPTQTSQQSHGIVVPPFIVNMQANNRPRGLEEPLPTMLTGDHHYVTVPEPFLLQLTHSDDRMRSLDAPMPTAMPHVMPSLVVPPYMVDLRGTNAPRELDEAISTVCATGNHHGLVVPPFLTSYYGGSVQNTELSEAVPSITTHDRHGIVVPPFLLSYYTRVSGAQAAVAGMDEPVPTVPGWAVHYVVQPGEKVAETPALEDCGFRMLQPEEIHRAMGFPAGYQVLGNQRERVRQYGNAVTPPVMELLVERCVATLR